MYQELSPIKVFSPRGQCIVLLFAALNELGGTVTKRQAIDFISDRRWFVKTDEDWKPYPKQKEQRWKTLIAWGRKDSVLGDLVLNNAHDSWALSMEGRRVWQTALRRFISQEWEVCEGCLWTQSFKKYLCPDYHPSDKDAKRPMFFYKHHVDWKAVFTALMEK